MGTRCDFWTLYKNKSLEYLGSIASDGFIDNFKEECKITNLKEWNSTIKTLIESDSVGITRNRGYKYAWNFTLISDNVLIFRENKSKVFLLYPTRLGKDHSLGVFVDPLDEYYLDTPDLSSINTFEKNITNITNTTFTICPCCNDWIDPDLDYNSCKHCLEKFGKQLFGKEKEQIKIKYNFDNPKNIDKNEEISTTFNFDTDFYYSCRWIKSLNDFLIFRKEISNELYKKLDKLHYNKNRFENS